ncbi:hypothetical protein [Xenorhabdus thuongxuanensis]|uniref:hypothetical protein n=1 Tax=Xenorhabdus thuongxuanensis TaxID=1873484 RepID=UPI001FCA0BAA|nr:hypothetical protein [Xenorhabdus thuongxuanensis]
MRNHLTAGPGYVVMQSGSIAGIGIRDSIGCPECGTGIRSPQPAFNIGLIAGDQF